MGIYLSQKEQYELQHMNAAMNNAALQNQRYASQAGLGLGAGQGSGYPEVRSSLKPEFGVLYVGKETLPDDWAGAKITSFEREVYDGRWRITFTSRWDTGLRIRLFLDIERVNGTEANTTASTYMDVLNQRRAG